MTGTFDLGAKQDSVKSYIRRKEPSGVRAIAPYLLPGKVKLGGRALSSCNLKAAAQVQGIAYNQTSPRVFPSYYWVRSGEVKRTHPIVPDGICVCG